MAENPLECLGAFDSHGNPASGLVRVQDESLHSLSIDEHAAILDARTFASIDYVHFRRFSDGRSSQVSAYVVDNSAQRRDEAELAQLHREVWLRGQVPLVYVAWPTRIDLLTCARGADFWKDEENACQYNPAKYIEIAGDVASELRQWCLPRLADGTFWEEPSNRELADYAKASHQSLIQAVVEADNALDKDSKPILRHLLLLMVLIKYLEDRRVFPDGWFSEFSPGAETFFDILRGGVPAEVYKLLRALEERFDGDMFSLPRRGLSRKALQTFARLVEAKTIGHQRYLWDQFSFAYLPVEIISHLYQRFVEGGHGAVYTPPFLAALLLDHAMPYDRLTGDERVLDPACGSGVFLVGAFRRLVNRWRSRHNWQRPEVETLKSIMRRSIYGVELDEFAVNLTAFSLSLAICDALHPDVIWDKLRFDPLRRTNLQHADFFEILLASRVGRFTMLKDGFDVVVGNPPFVSALSEAGGEVNRVSRLDSSRVPVPDKQLAYLFLEQSFSVLNPGGRVCLIQPSGLLHNVKAKPFQQGLFRKQTIDAVLDLASIRNLYDGADPSTIAISATHAMPTCDHEIKHLVFRRTVSVKERICFELDHYDRFCVPQADTQTDPYVWRVNLLGGGRLMDLSRRLRSVRTLGQYLDQMTKRMGWDYGEGYIAGKTGRRSRAPFLTGKPLLTTGAFTDEGIDETKLVTLQETAFASPRREAFYTPPLILIKETSSLPIVLWDKGFLAYGHRIVGIHAPAAQFPALQAMLESLLSRRDTYQFCLALHGTEALVGRATSIRKQDLDALPYPEDPDELALCPWEQALSDDVTGFMFEYVLKGEESKLLGIEAGIEHLRLYSSMFTQMLGSIYDNLQASTPRFLNGLICQPFYFGEPPTLSWLDDHVEHRLSSLVYDEQQHLRTVRVLRVYLDNVLLLIKPDRLRYWIRSTAIRDADETLAHLREWGY